MKQILIFLIVIGGAIQLPGQSWEVFSSYTANNYFDFKTCEGHCRKDLTSGNGFSLGFAWTNHIKHDWKMNTRVFVEQYRGEIYYSDGGNGGSDSYRLNVKKTTLSLTVLPLVLQLANAVTLDLGASANLLLFDDTEGRRVYNRLGQPTVVEDISEASKMYLSDVTAGVSLKLQYNIPIHQNWVICPFFTLYVGLSDDFKNLDTHIKSTRNNFGVSVGWE